MRLDKTQAKRLKDVGTIFMLLLLAVLTMIPIFWCIVTSLKTPQDISAYPPKVFNFAATSSNYEQVFAQGFLVAARNSVLYTFSATCRLL